MMRSETSRCRERLARFCQGDGLDLGCGGELIVPNAIGVDLPEPYTKVGDSPIQLRGDARILHWFRDASLDFVFSSHLLEDFPSEETEPILREWQRVLKPEGHLVIYGPDEKIFREHCSKTRQPYNQAHSVEEFGAAYVADVVDRIEGLVLVHRRDHCDTYSFELVARRTF